MKPNPFFLKLIIIITLTIVVYTIVAVVNLFLPPKRPGELLSLEKACSLESKGKRVTVDGFLRLNSKVVTCRSTSCNMIFTEYPSTLELDGSEVVVWVTVGDDNNEAVDYPKGIYVTSEFKVKTNTGEILTDERVRITGKARVSNDFCELDIDLIERAPEPVAKVVALENLCNDDLDGEKISFSGFLRPSKDGFSANGYTDISLSANASGGTEYMINLPYKATNEEKIKPKYPSLYPEGTMFYGEVISLNIGEDKVVEIKNKEFKFEAYQYKIQKDQEKRCYVLVEGIEEM